MSTEDLHEKFADADEEAQVCRVGVRVPPFNADEPALWFAQIEAQFHLSKITLDDTKFYYVAGQLEARYAMEVKDVITNPPAADKYPKIKAELIKRLSASQEKRTRQLLVQEELGDRSPLQFLRHLQNLAGAVATSDLLRTIWCDRLPHNVQTILASQSEQPLDKLADLADRVYELAPSTPRAPQVATTSGAATTYAPACSVSHAPVSPTDALTQQVNELTRQVALLTTNFKRGRSHSRSHFSSRPRRHSRSRPRMPQPPPNHPHCFYHYNFGQKAHKCSKPCSFDSGNSPGGRN
ncbi:uncharacterized protein LOC134747933 [Cydia strobilella]|uniref:uncharacterized protein LOC134747933 n=1 Tax=Cydia strobilella TaxID=1100964 RepID=UPI003004464B